ncbi:1-phosphofructokinase [Butyrivibrio sp. INlla18]|uniref:1-phosphofructokinase n=1 Tax=Butyrivibrio sp. INlla18 TaxID=1520806 RepID=UPI00088DC00F|nr:1-phosphofructokinase [Butyrivibrio sp. INlla18]SDA60435.1 1-phosphofructokinase [Butyrivibrio sp. INlla18]
MIYTVTFNPAIDYVVRMSDELLPGMTNRSDSEECYFGGKGINVSTILKNLGLDNTALGFVAGFTGDAIEKSVSERGIKADFIKLKDGISRINVKIKGQAETEINAQGPMIPEEDQKKLFDKINTLKDGDILILAGSIPNSLPSDVYEKIIALVNDRKIEVVVDATKDLLKNVLKYHPFLIKPNNHELGEMFGTVLKTDEEIETHAKKLQELGARNVLISMAGDGAMLITETGEKYRVGVPKGKVKNSVGAGDSMVAGFVAGYLQTGSYEEALKMGTAAGSATAFSDDLATGEAINELYKNL